MGNKRLIIVPDGILHYLPFETLITSRSQTSDPRFLFSYHDISYAPSASVLGSVRALRPEEKDRLELLAFGDPVFNSTPVLSKRGARRSGQRLGNAGADELQELVSQLSQNRGMNFEPLPHSKREVEYIAALYPEKQRKVYLGDKATETAVKKENLSRYRKIHFATHGIIDDQVPNRSGLVLSLFEKEEDGLLQTNEIFNLKLNADLVVLSACQSGLGKLVKGEGIIGLTRAFMYARAESVLVSLWSVNDESTAVFMKRFYRHMKSGKSKSQALRQAKQEMITSSTPAYKFPYFWAPFVLIGQAR